MAQKHDKNDFLEDYPTPPWATRALIEHVILDQWRLSTVWEPACGRGTMAEPLKEYFSAVRASDIHAYGYGDVLDFLFPAPCQETNWIITNPPFRLAAEFALRAFDGARVGVALLVRTSFLESADRWNNLFCPHRPSIVAPFVERVPMFKGRLDAKGSTATSYAWMVWTRIDPPAETVLRWIPPCKKAMTRPSDYDWPLFGGAP